MALEVVVKSRDLGDRWTGKVSRGGFLRIRAGRRPRPMTWEQALRRWPRLVAHMIAESLGYFTVRAAASALAHHKMCEAYACEWYSALCHGLGHGYFDEEMLRKIGADVVLYSIRNRNRHKGYMRSYQQAHSLVCSELEDRGCTQGMLAAWF